MALTPSDRTVAVAEVWLDDESLAKPVSSITVVPLAEPEPSRLRSERSELAIG